MQVMHMNIQKCEAFLKTVECGSLTKAAEALGYTQSGISHILNSLENEWKVSLLVRDRSGVRLTSDGLRLLSHVRNICNAGRELENEIGELHGLQTGLIRIGTFMSVATHWLPNIIKAFGSDYPNIDFELMHGDYPKIESWIFEGRVDFGFLTLPTKAKLESIFLEEDRMMAILPEDHPLAGLDRFPVERLSEERFILIGEGSDKETRAVFEDNGITPDVRFTAWEDATIMAMVESGLGISILPELVLHRAPYRFVAKELSKPYYRKLGVGLADLSRASVATRRFLEYFDRRKNRNAFLSMMD